MRKSRRETICQVVGLDLAGAEHRPTGFCVLAGKQVHTKILYGGREILEEIFSSEPLLVAIDELLTPTLDLSYKANFN